MINTRVQSDFVQHNDACLARCCIQLPHRRRDVRGGNNVGLPFDGGFDYCGVMGVGNKGNDEVMSSDGSLEGRCIRNIERDGGGRCESFTEFFSSSQSSASLERS
jgi:hypothetical protein